MANDQVSVEITIEERAALKALAQLSKGIDKVEKETKQFAKTQDSAWASFKGNIAAIGVSGAFRAIGSGLASLASGAIEASASAEKISTQLQILTGNADVAASLFAELKEFSAGTPFQLQGIAEASAQLLSFGFEADTVRDRLQKIGDVAAGSGSDLKEIALIYGQVAAAGKLTGERLLQLQERAIPIGPAIAKTMGVAESSVRELVSAGVVTQEIFEKAFNSMSEEGGMFAGGMVKQSKTLLGVTSTLSDNFDILQIAIGDAFRPKLIEGAEFLIEKLQDITEWVNKNQAALQSAAGFVGDYLDMWGTKIGGLFETETALDKVNKKLLEQDDHLGDLMARKKELESSDGGLFGMFKEHDAMQLEKINKQIAQAQFHMKEIVKERNELIKQGQPKQEEQERGPAGDRVQQEKEISEAVLAARAELNSKLILLEQDKAIQEQQMILAKKDATMAEREAALMAIQEHEAMKIAITADAEAQKAELIQDSKQKEIAQTLAYETAKLNIAKKSAETQKQIDEGREKHRQQMLSLAQSTLGAALNLAQENTAEYKALSVAQATISTYNAANQALATPPGPPFTIPLAALIVASGLARVKKITSASFAGGGVIGGFEGASMGADNQLAQVRKGEMVLNGQQQKQLFDDINKRKEEGITGSRNLETTVVVQIDEREIARAVRNQKLEGFSV